MIGTLFGGDGITQFAVPDFRGRYYDTQHQNDDQNEHSNLFFKETTFVVSLKKRIECSF